MPERLSGRRVLCAVDVTEAQISMIGAGTLRRVQGRIDTAYGPPCSLSRPGAQYMIDLDTGKRIEAALCWWAPERVFRKLIKRYTEAGRKVTWGSMPMRPVETRVSEESTSLENVSIYPTRAHERSRE